MLLKGIVFNKENDNVINGIREIINSLEVKNIRIGFSESIVSGTHFVKIFCRDEDFNDKTERQFNLYLSIVLYKILVYKYYSNCLDKFLNDNYFFLKEEELKDIKLLCLDAFLCEGKIEDENKVYYINRKNSIIKKVEKCLKENEEINIQGLITFRIKEMESDFSNIIDKVIEKYMVEKEYTEFIKLLKYFVEIQECKMEEVHIVIKENGEYLLKDNYGKDIMEEVLIEIKDPRYSSTTNAEDAIISGLITLAPERVIIHCPENCTNKELIKTIKSVFENRVSVCSSCNFCEIYNQNTIKT